MSHELCMGVMKKKKLKLEIKTRTHRGLRPMEAEAGRRVPEAVFPRGHCNAAIDHLTCILPFCPKPFVLLERWRTVIPLLSRSLMFKT